MLSDSDYMKRALELAQKARPISPPNPSVGCVIVRNHQVLGEVLPRKTGSDHAEIQLLKTLMPKVSILKAQRSMLRSSPVSLWTHTTVRNASDQGKSC